MISADPYATTSYTHVNGPVNHILRDRKRHESSVSTASSSTIFPEAPDGGYGWVAVFGAFMVHFIADGVSFSFGMLYPHIQAHYNAGKGQSAMVGSLFLSLPLLAAPIASALIDQFGCRPMIIVGGLLSSCGFICSFFAPSLPVLYLSFGLVSGCGLSLCFNASLVAVTYYFETKRAMATGLTVCGTGLGTFIMAPFIDLLLNKYGWQGTLLILAGVLLNLCVCGMIIRDLPWPEDSLEYKTERFIRKATAMQDRNSRMQSRQTSVPNLVAFWPMPEPGFKYASAVDIPTFLRERLDTETGSVGSYKTNVAALRSKSVATGLLGMSLTSPPPNVDHLDLPLPYSPRRQRFSSCTSYSAEPIPEMERTDSTEPSAPKSPAKWNSVDVAEIEARARNVPRFDLSNGTLVSGDAESQGLLERNGDLRRNEPLPPRAPSPPPRPHHHHRPSELPLPLAGRRMRMSSRVLANYPYYSVVHLKVAVRTPSAPALIKSRRHRHRTGATKLRIWITDFVENARENGAMLRSLSYSLFLLSNLLLYTFYDIPYVNLPEYAVSKLSISDKHSSFLVSIIGIVNTFGMIMYGLLADRKWVNKVLLYGISLCLCGVCVLVIPWLHSYLLLNLSCALFGLFISSNYVLSTILLVELLSLSEFVGALGWLGVVEGVGTLAGPILAGYLYDWTGNYLATFVSGGVGIIVSGLLVIAIDVNNWCAKPRLRVL